MRKLVFFLVALGTVPAAALGQQTVKSKPMINPDAPVNLAADNCDGDFGGTASKSVVCNGNVIVRQGEVTMRSNTIQAQIQGNKPRKITAQGKIVLDSPSGIATGDNGIYDVDPRIVTLTGNVVLTREKNVMRGKQLVVNLITGVANLYGGDAGKPGRVQAIFSNDNGSSETQNP